MAHLAGDYVFQTRWQSALKFGWTPAAAFLRGRHCLTYTLAFAPVAFAYGTWDGAGAFLVWLFFLHFLTDAQRFPSTLGDVIAWRLRSTARRRVSRLKEERDEHGHRLPRSVNVTLALPPPNPWQPIGLMLDQTLHLFQIAVLASILLVR